MGISWKRLIVSCVNWPRGRSDHGITTWDKENVRSLGARPSKNAAPSSSRKVIGELAKHVSSKCSRAGASRV